MFMETEPRARKNATRRMFGENFGDFGYRPGERRSSPRRQRYRRPRNPLGRTPSRARRRSSSTRLGCLAPSLARSASSRLCARATRRFGRVARAPARAVATRDDASAARAPSSSSAPSSAASPRSARHLPVVDLSESDAACASVIRDALFDGAGFFHVRNHGVPKPVVDAVVDAGTRFFDQPLAAKLELARARCASAAATRSPRNTSRPSFRTTSSPRTPRRPPRNPAPREGSSANDSPRDRSTRASTTTAPTKKARSSSRRTRGPTRHATRTFARRWRRVTVPWRPSRGACIASSRSPPAPTRIFSSRDATHTAPTSRWPTTPPSFRRRGAIAPPPRKKAHADSGTLTILARAAATRVRSAGFRFWTARMTRGWTRRLSLGATPTAPAASRSSSTSAISSSDGATIDGEAPNTG